MRTIVLMMASLLAGCVSTPPSIGTQSARAPVIFVAVLDAVEMTHDQALAEPEPDADRIVVSNSCGTLKATFGVVQSTRPMPSRFVASFSIGEWCVPPIPFEYQFWLVVLEPDRRGVVAVYPLFDDSSRLYACADTYAYSPTRDDPYLRRVLAPQRMDHPIDHSYNVSPGTPSWAACQGTAYSEEVSQPPIEGIPIDGIFPGMTLDVFLGLAFANQ